MKNRFFRLFMIFTVLACFGLIGCGNEASSVVSEDATSSESFTSNDDSDGLVDEDSNLLDAYSPQIGVDSSGNAMMVWYQWDGTQYNIYSSRYEEEEGALSADELIEFDDTGDAYDPQVALDSSGNAAAVWSQYNGSQYNIWANYYVAGSGWGSAELIETSDSGDAFDPYIVMDQNGNAVVVWYQWDGSMSNIWANRYEVETGSWGMAELIEFDNDGNSFNPQVAVDPNGNAMVVWLQYDNSRYTIWSNRYAVEDGWGSAELIETYNNGNVYSPKVGMDSSGNAVVVWLQHDDSQYNILFNRYEVETGWSVTEVVEANNAENIFNPQIAVASSGSIMVVWTQYDGSRYNIWSNRYEIGIGWDTPSLIDTDDAGNANNPTVAVDFSGNAVVVWTQYDGSRYNIWSNRYEIGIGWDTPSLIETDDAGNANNPTVAVDSSGNAVAVWSQSDGTYYNIQALLY